MRLLLTISVIGLSASGAVPNAGSVVSFYRQPLLKSVHQQVASGYSLYSAKLPAVLEGINDLEQARAVQGYLLLSSDRLIDGSAVCCQAVHTDDSQASAQQALHTVGIFSQESGMVDVSYFSVFDNFSLDGTTWLTSDYHLKRVNDKLLRLSASEDGMEIHLGFERSKDYRVYRGQRQVDRDDGSKITVTETITINGHNPYVIFRHTSWQVDQHSTNDELSIGYRPMLAINPPLVHATVVETDQSQHLEVNNPRPVSTDISYIFDGNTLTERNGEGEVAWSVALELIENSDVWLEFEGNSGVTGGGIETRLVDQLRNKGMDRAAQIAEELANQLRRP